jgi:hypothetical protein
MNPRIVLDETEFENLTVVPPKTGNLPVSAVSPHLAHADWESPTDDALMLYLAEDPQIGVEFSYNGLEWRIVDYRDGWVARLLV